MREIAETKRMINGLRRRMGEEPLYADVEHEETTGPIRKDMYYGKPLSTAARMFLERRKTACTPEEIMKGMEAGGFDFKAMNWKEADRLRVFAITLGKNSQIFHRLPNDTIGLLEWYPTVAAAKKDKAEKEQKNGGAAEGAAEEEPVKN
jgi:hypothetical protein